MKYLVLKSLTAAVLLASGVAAHATATSSVQMSLSINLIDLDTSDGIAPSIVFQPSSFLPDTAGQVSYLASSSLGANGPLAEVSDVQQAKPAFWTPFADVSASHAGLVSANASIDADASSVFGPHIFSASGAADALGVGGLAALRYSADTEGAAPFHLVGSVFTLSANTRVEFVANIQMQAATLLGVMPGPGVYMTESAYADYDMSVRGTSAGSVLSYSRDRIGVGSNSLNDPSPDSASFSRVVMVQLLNTGNASMGGRFTIRASASGDSALMTIPPTPVVPEADALAMVLGGLGVVGALGVRGRARRARSL